MSELLEELRVGSRLIANSNWPVVDQLWRDGPRSWRIVREVCNGVPRGSELYRSEEAAREAFAGRMDGRKPRAIEPSTERIAIRVTTAEKLRWSAAAESDGLILGAWLIALAEREIAGRRP